MAGVELDEGEREEIRVGLAAGESALEEQWNGKSR
jgi:hypothetical protein